MNTPPRPLLLSTAMMAITLLIAGCNKPPEVLGATPPSAAPTSNVADGDVTTNVTTALLQHSAFKGLDINVITLKGDVRLIGVVDNQGQIDPALKVARGADGVHSIHDELSVRT